MNNTQNLFYNPETCRLQEARNLKDCLGLLTFAHASPNHRRSLSEDQPPLREGREVVIWHKLSLFKLQLGSIDQYEFKMNQNGCMM